MDPAAALGDEALGKRGEGCRASPLLRRGRTVQTLAKVYEDRAAECSRAAQQTDDPVFRRLLLMLASQWKRRVGLRGAVIDVRLLRRAFASLMNVPSRRRIDCL